MRIGQARPPLMNAMAKKPRNLLSLFWHDFTIKNAMKPVGMGLMIAAGGQWMSQTLAAVPASVPASVEHEFDVSMAFYMTVGGLVLAALSAVIVLWRYSYIRRVLNDGNIVEATIEKLESSYSEVNSDSSVIGKRSYRYFYYATVCYFGVGVEHKIRIRLPSAGLTYGLVKGEKTAVSFLQSEPHKPLIRAVYLAR